MDYVNIAKKLLKSIYNINIIHIDEIYKYEPHDRYIFKYKVGTNIYILRMVKDKLDMTRINTINCMKLAKRYLKNVIPRVYHHGYYNGYDYIIMEYIEGLLLLNIWKNINNSNKDKVIRQLKEIVRIMRKIEFNFIGSIKSMDNEKVVPGPITDYNIVEGRNINKWNRGPFLNIEDWLISGLMLELDKINNIRVYNKVLDLINYLRTDHRLFDSKSVKFVLSHCDFDIWNIIIDNEFNIKGIIDWEYAGSYPDYYEYIKRLLLKSDIKDLFKTNIEKNLLNIEYIKQNLGKVDEKIICEKINNLIKNEF